jgi:hypothetical protein
VLWAVILLLLCLCIYRADKLAHSMRSVACNTTFTNVTEDSKNDGANFPLQTQNFVDHGDDFYCEVLFMTIIKKIQWCCTIFIWIYICLCHCRNKMALNLENITNQKSQLCLSRIEKYIVAAKYPCHLVCM